MHSVYLAELKDYLDELEEYARKHDPKAERAYKGLEKRLVRVVLSANSASSQAAKRYVKTRSKLEKF